MADSFNLYTGDGSTVTFSFTFEYLETSDIYVTVDEQQNTDWSFDTTTDPTSLTFNSAPAQDAKIVIFRATDLDQMEAVFAAGSAIRAKDLNTDYDQLRLAIQEAKEYVPDVIIDDQLDPRYWQKEGETIESTDTWTENDTTIATTKAVGEYVRASEQVVIPEAPNDGKQYGRQSESWTEIQPGGVSKIIAGNNVTISPTSGEGEVTINSTATGGGGGATYKGTIDMTLAAPAAENGDFYVNTATSGTVNASWTGLGGTALTGGERVIYNGDANQWDMLPSEVNPTPLWTEDSGKLYPATLTNNVQVGGTSADPNISLNADGSGIFTRRIDVANSTTNQDEVVFAINTGASLSTTQRFKADGSLQIGNISGPADTANISLNASGSAEFAGDVQAGGNPSDAASTGTRIYSGGLCQVSAPNTTSPVFRAYRTGSSTITSLIKADGSANFSQDVTVGPYDLTDTVNGNGARIKAEGNILVQRRPVSGSNSIFDGRLGNIQTVNILADGSATFASKVTANTYDLESLDALP